MMKTLLALFLLLFFSSLHARIGDSPSAIENRIVSSNLGREYPKEQRTAKWDEFPYSSMLSEYQGATEDYLDYRVYWKSHDRKRVSSTVIRDVKHPDGWDLHVLFKGGHSVFEAYRRNGESLNKFEINALLALNQGDSHWEEAPRGTPSAFGVTYERADGLYRAHIRRDRGGHYFIIYLKSMDEKITEVREFIRKVQEQEQEERLDDSVVGF